ncbi:MAG TPA: ribosome-binding factor A [Candidatus Paceibacterota bacterium]
MRERRTHKLGDEVRDLVATYLEEHSDRTSLITVTRVELLRNGKLARCYVSVFPPEREEASLGFANRNLAEIKSYIASKTKMRMIPNIQIVSDQGEKNRQRIDELLRK